MKDIKIIHQCDWIGSNPLFFNYKTNQFSSQIRDVINYNDFSWDYEGLEIFLEFGFSALGRTPIKDVHFLLPGESLSINNEKLCVHKSDLNKNILDETFQESTPKKCIDLITDDLRELDKETNSLILPLSGGLDSRLLAQLYPSKEKINAYTYGISWDQSNSFEVVIAKKISRELDIKWKHIKIGNFHQFLPDYVKRFGLETHAHGMYHFEFYNNIRAEGNRSQYLLSGLIGDAWAGSIHPSPMNKPIDLTYLAHNHGMNASSSYMYKKASINSIYEKYWEENHDLLKNEKYRIIATMQTKMMLLRYLIELPKEFGIKVHAPFIDKNIALSMLNLPKDLRNKRTWQTNYFLSHSQINTDHLIFDKSNSLNTQGLRKFPLEPLNPYLLSEILNPNYIKWINKNILNDFKSSLIEKASRYSKDIRPRRIHRKIKKLDKHLIAYAAYLTIYPLQELIKQRDERLKQ